MKSKLGTLLIVFGCLLIMGSLGVFLFNQEEQIQADTASREAIPMVVEAIQTRRQQISQETQSTEPAAAVTKAMPVVEIRGYDYVGFLWIPSLGLELPVMNDWSYDQLQMAPCRYTGSIYTDDLVIMAHNYPRQFGKLRDLRAGDTVSFTDMDGEITEYEVIALDVLAATAVEEMTAGDYDLTLFTCAYGGKSRITLRCDRAAR